MATLIGQTLLSQFRVDAFVAAGGMGSVYRVWDLKRNVPLAMKVLHSELAEDPSMFKKFQREARALQKLAHPNIVSFYGIYESMDVVFMLERFVDGPSIKDILKQYKGKPLPTQETLIYLKSLCSALGYAHANGVVHCDVKPGNVMIDSSGQIYLTDFGIARHAESATTTIDSAGTSAYMPPEQIMGEPVTPAADVYALGIMLYEMLTGRRPFRGSGAETVSDKSSPTISMRIRQEQLHLQAQDPQELNPAISVELAKVALQALNKQPEKRYKDATQFFAAICDAVNVSPSAIPDRAIVSNAVQQNYEGPATVNTPEGGTKNSLIHILIGVAGVAAISCVVIAIAVGAFIWRGQTGMSSQPSYNQSATGTLPNPVQTNTSHPINYTSTPDYGLQTSVAVLTQGARLPTSTPTIRPTPTSPFCSNLKITEKPTSKGLYLAICYPGGKYEMGPWEKGNFATGPNDQFFVYVASSGRVYAVTVGEGQQIRTLEKLKNFTAIIRKDDPQYRITFSSGPPYTAYITETLYNQSASVSIPSWLSNP